ncbi:hypothetical protein ACI09V_003162 [Cronobacter dublinensis]
MAENIKFDERLCSPREREVNLWNNSNEGLDSSGTRVVIIFNKYDSAS